MAVLAMAYNTLDGFSDPGRSNDLVEFVRCKSPDVAFFSEAYAARHHSSAPLRAALGSLMAMGYQVVNEPYNDRTPRQDSHGFIGIVKAADATAAVHRFRTRNGFRATARDPQTGHPYDFFGSHMSDLSEEERLRQLMMFRPAANSLFGTDSNALHGDTLTAAMLRLAQPFADRLPAAPPGQAKNLLEKIGTDAQRFTRMASGRTLRRLAQLGLLDADATRRQPTFTYAGRRLVKLDCILHGSAMQLTGEGVTVHTKIELSDHSPISASFIVLPTT